MRAEVWSGLRRTQKEISPKYFYDERGSELFDRITQLDEYYPTRTERAILQDFAPAWMRSFRPRALVELGPGSAAKTRILLREMDVPGAIYVPVDISPTYLAGIVADVGNAFEHIHVVPSESDIAHALDLPPDLPAPAVFAFLGSTIGNFEPDAALQLLGRTRKAMRTGDRFLMGADLVKDVRVIEAAYNDAQGVTAEFNRNVLDVLNREIGTDFDSDAFEHHAFFNPVARRIEMHLVARDAQRVHVPQRGSISIAAGESIRTEISCKYDREAIDSLFTRAGFRLERWVTDAKAWYALAVGRPC
jgi:L-histidine N-alpha-methyltransferase